MDIKPFYRRIYDQLREDITSGRLLPGAQVPSEKELCQSFKVSRITSKRALEMLAEQGYISRHPGKGSFVSASFLQSRKLESPAIGFLTPDFSDSFGTKLIYGMEETCTALGYHFILKRTRDRSEEEAQAINAFARSGMAGMLILPIHGEFYNSEILKLILDKRAVVFVDRKMRGLAAPTVTTDNLGAVELGVEYLLRLGHRNVAFYSGPVTDTSTVEDRYQGFVKAFAKFGVSHDPAYFYPKLTSVWTYPFYARERVSADVDLIKEHLAAHPEISAAFAAEYSMGLIVKAAVEKLGRRIPEDFSILSFDAPPPIVGTPPFTHLCQDEYTIGKQAIETLHRIILGSDPASIGDILVEARLIKGASCAPVK